VRLATYTDFSVQSAIAHGLAKLNAPAPGGGGCFDAHVFPEFPHHSSDFANHHGDGGSLFCQKYLEHGMAKYLDGSHLFFCLEMVTLATTWAVLRSIHDF
jgi:hypothetical protein